MWPFKPKAPKGPAFNSDDIPTHYKDLASSTVYVCDDCGMTHRPLSVLMGLVAVLQQLHDSEPCECPPGEAMVTCRHAFKHVANNHLWISLHGESKNRSAEYWANRLR
jgi:hypothetical protein